MKTQNNDINKRLISWNQQQEQGFLNRPNQCLSSKNCYSGKYYNKILREKSGAFKT